MAPEKVRASIAETGAHVAGLVALLGMITDKAADRDARLADPLFAVGRLARAIAADLDEVEGEL